MYKREEASDCIYETCLHRVFAPKRQSRLTSAVPSWPSVLSPQAYTALESSTQSECDHPAAIISVDALAGSLQAFREQAVLAVALSMVIATKRLKQIRQK
jgi:hypothetical protein